MEIFGKISDSISKKPVEKAKITLRVKNEEAAEELAKELAIRFSDSEGKFEHKEVTQYIGDTLIYSIEKDGYKPLEGSKKIDGVKITLDKELTGNDIEVKLRLRDEIQNALGGVRVYLEVDGNRVGEGSSDKDGLFKTSLSPEYEGKELSYKAELTGFEAISGKILLQKNNYLEIIMKRTPEVCIFGTVKDGAKIEPIPGAKIGLYIGDKELTVISSDAKGKFRYDKKGIQYLGETLRYRVEMEGYKPFDGTRKIEHEKMPLEIELTSEKPSLELIFKDKTGTPLENVKITLELDGRQVKVGVSDKNGLFKVTLSPDIKDKSLSYKAEIEGFELSSGKIELAKETSREITMIGTPSITISGKVEDNAGKPISGAKVSLILGDKELSVLRSDGKGEFRHEETGGQYAGADLKYRVEKEGYKLGEGSSKVREDGARLAVTLSPMPIPTPPPKPSSEPKKNGKIPIIPIAIGVLALIAIVWLILLKPGPVVTLTIDEFEASPNIINPHENSTLRWAVSNAESVLLNGERVESSGTKTASPTESTTYILVARRGNEKAEKKAEIKVEIPKEMTIDKFEASPMTIGRHENTTLSWAVYNAETVLLNNERVDPSGSKIVNPRVSTTYTLIAQSDGENVVREIKVAVEKPKINYFEADYETISPEDSARLSWDIDYAETASLESESYGSAPEEISVNPKSETHIVEPKRSTDYTLKATSKGETDTQSIRIVVKRPAKIEKFEADPTETFGGNTTLSWSVSNADKISIDPEPTERPLETAWATLDEHGMSGQVVVEPKETTTYTLTAWNEGEKATESVLARATASATVKVSPIRVFIPRYPIVARNLSIKSP